MRNYKVTASLASSCQTLEGSLLSAPMHMRAGWEMSCGQGDIWFDEDAEEQQRRR